MSEIAKISWIIAHVVEAAHYVPKPIQVFGVIGSIRIDENTCHECFNDPKVLIALDLTIRTERECAAMPTMSIAIIGASCFSHVPISLVRMKKRSIMACP